MQISSRAVMFWDFQLPPKIFYGVEIWRLARPLQDLEMLLTKPLLRCPGGVFGIIVMLKDPATFQLQCPCWWKEVFTQNLTIHGPIHSFLYTDQSSWSLCRKTAPSMMFPPPCFTVGMVFFGCNSAFFLLQTRQVEFLPKSYILVSSDHMTFSQSSSGSSKCSLANFRRAWTCTGLSRGTRLALQDLSPWRRSVLLMVAFVTLVPALCRSFTRSPPCGSGIFAHSSCDHFDPTGWDLAWSPRSREIISGLVCLPFSNNCSHSWFLHTKLLTYCRFSLPSLVQVYNFVSGVLWQLFGLGHSGVWSVTVWGCGQVSFILITSSNRCH